MDRINLTLDEGTSQAIEKHAKKEMKPRATVARELIHEALARRAEVERTRQLARDYAAGREEARALLAELEPAELETWRLLEEE